MLGHEENKRKMMLLRIRTADGEDHYFLVGPKQREQLQRHIARAEKRP